MRVEPSGPIDARFMLVGEAPGHEEQMAGEPFVGKSGRELWAGMRRFCGLTRDQFRVLNIIPYGLPNNRDPKPLEIAEAMPEFLERLEETRPEIVVTAGAFSTKAMLGDVRMSDVHGIPHKAEVCGQSYTVLSCYHPAAGLHNKGFLAAFAYDLDRLGALLRGEGWVWEPSTRQTDVQWLSEAPSALPKTFKGVVALDTEGWEAKPWGLSFSPDGENAFIIRTDEPELLRVFGLWLRGKTVVGHNLIHDIPVLRAMGIEIGAFHDTQVLGYHDMLRTGSGVLESESQNLGTLAYRECGLRLHELSEIPGVDFDTQTIPYSDEVMQYAGMDTIATHRLFSVYQQRGLTDYPPYQIDMGQVPLVEEMVRTGLPIDTDAALDFYLEVLGKIEETTADLRMRAARFGNRDFNPGSHPQVRELITRKIGLRVRKRTRGGQASTNEKALSAHKDHPFVAGLQTYRELTKLRGTYLLPLLEELQ